MKKTDQYTSLRLSGCFCAGLGGQPLAAFSLSTYKQLAEPLLNEIPVQG